MQPLSVMAGIVSALRGWTVDLDLVPSTFGYPVFVKYGGPDQMPPPTPTPTSTPTPVPLFAMTPDQTNAFNHYFSSLLTSYADKHPSYASPFNLSSFTHQPTASNPIPFGFPRLMDTDLFSPLGFITFLGFIVAATLPLWTVLGLACRGGMWYLRSNVRKK